MAAGVKDSPWWKKFFPLHFLLFWNFLCCGLTVNVFQLLSFLLIWPWNRTLYRRINCHLAYTFWSHFSFLGQWWSGGNVLMKMKKDDFEKFVAKEHCLIVMNHKYDIDWLMGWVIVERLGILGSSKMIGKVALRYVPIIGWSFYFVECMFLRRQWEKDRLTMQREMKEMVSYPLPEHAVMVLLFPEGTRFTVQKRDAANKVAVEKGLVPLKHVLLPRSKGFVLLRKGLVGKIAAVYDFTMAFRQQPGPAPSLKGLMNGHPFTAEAYCRRFPLEEIPEDEEGCSKWLQDLFQSKDELFDYFLKNNTFPDDLDFVNLPRRYHDLVTWSLWLCYSLVPLGWFVVPWLLGHPYFFLVLAVCAHFGYRKMVGVTETGQGSSYGLS